MTDIRYVQNSDKEFWFTLDAHLSADEFYKKVRDRQGYVLTVDSAPAAILRYNLFWDSIPFCNMLFVDSSYQRIGLGTALMKHWEQDMKKSGYGVVMTSTQSDETAQHFYRKSGYTDCGSLIMTIPGYEQAAEIFFIKKL